MNKLNLQELKKGHAFLSKADPVMAGLIKKFGEVVIEPEPDLYRVLVHNIVSQVISNKAAATVWRRLENQTGFMIKPEVMLDLSQEEFRNIGIGRQKYRYIMAISEAVVYQPESLQSLHQLDDPSVIKKLTELPGIGKWTAQMVLLFGLGRLDVFAPDDLALRKAMEELYSWTEAPKRSDLLRKAETWAPYRSIASLLLWQSQK